MPPGLRRSHLALLLLVAVAACGGARQDFTYANGPGSPSGPTLSPQEAGKQAVDARGCGGCHTGTSGFLAGNTSPVPGTQMYAPNLTPDEETGLGSWTDAQIIGALRTGTDDEGQTLCSTMPRYPDLSDAEAAAIVAYLRSLPKVRTDVPEGTCADDDPVANGKTLVETKGCGGCHSPATGPALSGADAPLFGTQVTAPNLTPDSDTGIGGWSDADLVRAIRQGLDDQGVTLCAAMPRYPTMSDDDAAAIVAYLKSLAPVSHQTAESVCAEKPADPGTSDAGTVTPTTPGTSDAGSVTPVTPAPAVDAGSSSHADAGHALDAGTPAAGDGGLLDGYFVVSSSGNKLPAAWTPSTIAALDTQTPSAASHNHVAARVKVTGTFSVVSSPCPLPYVGSTGTSCDGFTAHSTVGDIVVDTFSFLGSTAPCAALLPPAGPLSSVVGTWQPHVDATTGAVSWVVAPGECSDLGLGTAPSRASTAATTSDVQQLRSSFVPGQVVTVRGVVTAVRALTSRYTFVLQDPGAGVNSAIDVVRVRRAGVALGTPPAIGDAVTVTGTTSVYAATGQQELKL